MVKMETWFIFYTILCIRPNDSDLGGLEYGVEDDKSPFVVTPRIVQEEEIVYSQQWEQQHRGFHCSPAKQMETKH